MERRQRCESIARFVNFRHVPLNLQEPHCFDTTMESEKSSMQTSSYRSHNCGELRLSDQGKEVNLCGWVQKARDAKNACFIDLRDRFGITQLVIEPSTPELYKQASGLGREFVISVTGLVKERSAKVRLEVGLLQRESLFHYSIFILCW
jgi:hypothetical protein